MIKSMTGFATAELRADETKVAVEIRSYNSRYLDISLRVSNGYVTVEDRIKSLVAERRFRGRLEIKVQIEDESTDTDAFEIDAARTKALMAVMTELKDAFAFQDEISLDLILGMGGIIKPVEAIRDIDTIWPLVKDCLHQALDELDAMRQKEGKFLAQDIQQRLAHIEGCLDQIKQDSGDLLTTYQERLKERIAILTRETVEIDPARIAQEAAFLADRSDISEEIVRAGSHINQFRDIMSSSEPGGRKLNFLLQEMNREFNTMGSKIGNAATAHLIVEVKSELEKIKEQIQNVE